MQWTIRGAHLLLQTRTKILKNELEGAFRRWSLLSRVKVDYVDPQLSAAFGCVILDVRSARLGSDNYDGCAQPARRSDSGCSGSEYRTSFGTRRHQPRTD